MPGNPEKVRKERVGTVGRIFNVSADCKPELHYMADISEKLRQIKAMVDEGQYFTINRARQYGKTTTLNALERILEDDYVVIHLDFQLLGNADFETEPAFVAAFSSELLENMAYIPEEIRGRLSAFADDGPGRGKLRSLFRNLRKTAADGNDNIASLRLVLNKNKIAYFFYQITHDGTPLK